MYYMYVGGKEFEMYKTEYFKDRGIDITDLKEAMVGLVMWFFLIEGIV